MSDYNVSLNALYLLPRSKVTGYAQDLVGSQGGWMYGMSPVSQHGNLKYFLSLFLLNDCFIPSKNSCPKITMKGDSKNCRKHCLNTCMLKCIITLMLLMSGNVQPNPGPGTDMISLQTPADFLNRSGIGFVHINVRSLLPNIDMVRIWAKSTNVDIMVLSETWLGRSTPDSYIYMEGYNIFRTDHRAKGGGVAIYVKNSLLATVHLSKSVPKQFELLVLKIELSQNCVLTVAGCYRPHSAPKDTLSSLSDCLSSMKYTELALMGDLNWDWLTPASDLIKSFCDLANLTQIIDSPTRPNPKHPEKSTLLDLFLTNMPQKYKATAVFANDMSDHCVIAGVRDTKISKCKPRIIIKRNLKLFCEQAFLIDLNLCDWNRVNLILEPEIVLQYFKSLFLDIINKHAPFRKYKIKGRDNPWHFTEIV